MASDQTQNPAAAPRAASGEIEERRDAYRPGGFHPVYIGEVYAGKYEVMNKIGYGVYSTVWLVKDLSKQTNDEHQFAALKVLRADCYNQDHPIFEREILSHLRNGNRRLLGYKFQGDIVPTPIMRKFTFQLICALDYAHEEGVIHTDIKRDNILVKFRDMSRIESEYLVEEPIPKQDKTEKQYTPIPSRPLRAYYFGSDHSKSSELDNKFNELDIALGDWGVSSWTSKHLTENIQPVALRAPEVLIKAPWDTKADWWNLGAVIIEVYRAVRLFDGRVPPDGHYELWLHLAEIEDLFGPFPKDLRDKGDPEITKTVFDEEGKVKRLESVDGPPLESEEYLPGLDQQEREMFASFLRTMMKVNPAERPTPEEMVVHPWLRTRR